MDGLKRPRRLQDSLQGTSSNHRTFPLDAMIMMECQLVQLKLCRFLQPVTTKAIDKRKRTPNNQRRRLPVS